MKKYFVLFALIMATSLAASAQTPAPTPNAAPPRQDRLDIAQYGVQVEADQRLIVIMAALEAASFDAAPGREVSAFRAQVRRELQDLDPDLRERLRRFVADHNRELFAEYEPRMKKAASAGERADLAAEFAARTAERYISLAYALGPAPVFEMPPRSDDLPGGVLELLDFTPLLREFYRKANMDEMLVKYTRIYRKTGDDMRPALADMVRGVLSYLHTQPQTVTIERKEIRSPDKKKNALTRTVTREYERRFIIVPDLLAVPGAINLRVIADDYYVIVPAGITPASSEMRRAYLQYVADPLTLRFNKEIALRREDLKKLLDERRATGRSITPDVFLAVARSLIIAAEVRMNELNRHALIVERINTEPEAAQRRKLLDELKAAQTTLSDEAIRQLSVGYDNGAVLAFYFAEQLKGLESSGFDITGLMPDMLASFDVARESKRGTENAAARQRAELARAERLKTQPAAGANEPLTGRALMLERLSQVEGLLRQENYPLAETQLKELLTQYPGEPRIFFALGRAASGAAQRATDEVVQEQRLNTALGQYRLALEKASPDTDKPLISRAYYAMGQIYAHFEQQEAAMKAFDAAIALGPVTGGAFREAIDSKARLTQP